MKAVGSLIVLMSLYASAPVRAAEIEGLAREGARIARESCAPCHALDERSKPGAGPGFREIARMPSTTGVAIKVFLKTPHANMPNIMLTEAEIDAIAAYILDLRNK